MARTFHPTANTSMCHVRMTQGVNLQENTFAYHWVGGTPSSSELLSLATAVAGGIGAAMRALTSTQVVFREVYCRNIDTEVAAENTYSWPANTTGQRIGAVVAASEACGIVKRTGLTGRGSHGRNSISNFTEADLDGNTVLSSLLALLTALATQILIPLVASRFTPAVAHIPRTGTTTGTSTPISQAVVLDSNVDSQKTRLNSHGR